MKKSQLVGSTGKISVYTESERAAPGSLTAMMNSKKTSQSTKMSQKKVLPDIARQEDALTGCLDNVPEPNLSIVRIFLSSTFTDFKTERNALFTNVYPKLKQFCAKLGLDFQVVDMRWGVTDEASSEHMTEKLCIQEIINCQRLSYGPNFVLLLGNRYGYQPFPNVIEENLFTLLVETAERLSVDNVNLLHDWFKKDRNAVPVSYVLQPIKSKLEHYGDRRPEFEKERLEAKDKWYKIESSLQKILQTAALEAFNRGQLPADQKHNFFRSVTESEATLGILNRSYPKESSLCYMRHLTDVEKDIDNNLARRHTDAVVVDGKPMVKQESQDLLQKLKTEGVQSKLPNRNVKNFTLDWRPEGVVPNRYDIHRKYIDAFCHRFTEDIKWLVQQHRTYLEKEASKFGKALAPLLNEVHHHLRFCNLKCEIFHGREAEITQVKKYFLNNGSLVKKPFVIHAASGSGKTALMAVLAKRTKEWLGKDSVVMIRFLGTSGNSSAIVKTLASLCQQICVVYDIRFEPEKTHQIGRLIKYFHHLLVVVKVKGGNMHPLVIFFDSLDQLGPNDHAHRMAWLPKICPKYVSIVVSTLPNLYDCLENLKKHLGTGDVCYLNLAPLSAEVCNDIMKSYLQSKERTITKKQQSVITDAFTECSSPLFLKLLLDEASTWNSYTAAADINLPKSPREAIWNLFEKLEVKYGKVFISYALGYLTVGRNGLSSIEMEDILSCNDKVLNEVYQYHDPPVKGIVRIPPLLWSRVNNDIRDYTVERQTDGKTTSYWYHRQFIEAAEERYAKGNIGMMLHDDLAKLYLAEDGITKTFTLEKRKLNIEGADRQVTKQAIVQSNIRMMNSIIYHLNGAGNLDNLKHFAFCRLKFLKCFIQAFSVQDLIQSMTDSLRMADDEELEAVRDCLRFSERTICENLSALPVQIWGQLGSLGAKFQHVENLCHQCCRSIEENNKPMLFPVFPCLPSSTGELKSYIEGVTAVLDTSSDKKLMVAQFWDEGDKVPVCKVLSMESFSVISTLDKFDSKLKGLTVNACKISPDKTLVFLLTNTKLFLYNLETGAELYDSGLNINNAGVLNSCLDVSQDKKTILFAGKERICFSFDLGKSSGQPNFDLGWHKTLKLANSIATLGIFFESSLSIFVSVHTINAKSKTSGAIVTWDFQHKLQKAVHMTESPIVKRHIVFTSDELLIFCCKNGQIGSLDLKAEKFQMAKLMGSDLPGIVSVSYNDENELFAFCTSDNVLAVWSPQANELVGKLMIEESHKMSAIVWLDEEHCVTGDAKGYLKVWNVNSGDEIFSKLAHEKKVTRIMTSLDGYYVVSYGEGGSMKLWDLEAVVLDEEERKHQESRSVEEASTDDAPMLLNEKILYLDIASSGDGGADIMTSSGDSAPKIWDLATSNFKYQLPEHICTNVLYCLENTLVVGLRTDKMLKFWKVEEREIMSTGIFLLNNWQCVCFVLSEDKNMLASLLESKGARKVVTVDLKSSVVVNQCTIAVFYKTIHDICLAKDGRYVVFLYDSQTSRSGCLQHSVKAVDLESETVDCMRTCKNMYEKTISSANTETKCYTLCNYDDNLALLGCFGVCPAWNVQKESADLLKMPNNHQWLKHSTALYFNKKMKETNTARVAGSMDKCPITAIVVSTCGSRYVVTGADDGSLILWLTPLSLAGAEEGTRKFLYGHTAGVTSIALSQDSKLLISGSKDGTIRLWNLTNYAKELASITVYMTPQLVRFSPDEKYVVAVGEVLDDKRVLVFELRNCKVEGSVLPKSV